LKEGQAMEKSNDTPIFEQGTKEQKANKPAIKDVCNYFLTDDTLKTGMARLLELSNELKMKPVWIQRNGFKCTYKSKGLFLMLFQAIAGEAI